MPTVLAAIVVDAFLESVYVPLKQEHCTKHSDHPLYSLTVSSILYSIKIL